MAMSTWVAGQGSWVWGNPMSGGLRSTTLSPSPMAGDHGARADMVPHSRAMATAAHCEVPGNPLATDGPHHR